MREKSPEEKREKGLGEEAVALHSRETVRFC